MATSKLLTTDHLSAIFTKVKSLVFTTGNLKDACVTEAKVDPALLQKIHDENPTKVSQLTNDLKYQTESQVNTTVTTKIAEVVASAPEDFDTLKEIADWISTHGADAAEMNSKITTNTNNIASNLSKINTNTANITTNTNNITNLTNRLDAIPVATTQEVQTALDAISNNVAAAA